MNLSMTQAVNSSLTRMNSGVRISLLNRRREMLKKKRFFLSHAEADMSLTAGRGTRWSERWHGDMPALCLPHPSSTQTGWQQRHNPATLSTFQHRLHLCFQEEQETRTTHTHAHTYTSRHTPCVQLECKKFSLCIHEGCLCLSPLLSFFKQIITAFFKKIIIINLKKYKLRHFVPTPNDPKDKKMRF